MSRRAKDWAEYNRAVASITWFKECGAEMDGADLQRLAVATNALTDLFLSPRAAAPKKAEP
jgi:hypothetical protein